ncbi:type 1 glutamine amidotransferase domain-containing protein [Halopiger goleimassiliensis]|uniref:type 1 glutamine amidotransferase domain-containing protein n=1 Tax=Halopiger goleimassiliensis TaxID=1293048 RepID=UPI0006780246|nr:type 1 glutamine amidotransferase domain-containing protein [Halopiger goleimassiliensis]
MRAIVLATDGVEDSEFNYPYYRLQEAGHEVDVATPDGETIEGKTGYEFEADYAIDEYDADRWADEYDLLVVPGGYSPEPLRLEAPEAADIVAAFDDADQPIAAICHGAQLLISADVLEDRSVAAYWSLEDDVENAGATFVDEEVVVDDNLVTARVPDDLPAFASEVLALLEEEPIAA